MTVPAALLALCAACGLARLVFALLERAGKRKP